MAPTIRTLLRRPARRLWAGGRWGLRKVSLASRCTSHQMDSFATELFFLFTMGRSTCSLFTASFYLLDPVAEPS